MDKLDWKILDLLQENARYLLAEIDRKIGLSASAVAERIQKLEDNEIIEGYTISINKKHIGLPLSASQINLPLKVLKRFWPV